MVVEIDVVQSESADFREVLALWRQARKWLGFMPDQGFKDRALQGNLVAAKVDGRPVGYIMFDLPGDLVKVVHLCIDPSWHRKGIAQRLIEWVADEHRERQGIKVVCRPDEGYEAANALWERAGFRKQSERPGRNFQGIPLAVWFLPFRTARQLSLDDVGRKQAVLDLLTVIDIHDGANSFGSEDLLDPWLAEYVNLQVVPAVFEELDRAEQKGRSPATRSNVERFPVMEVAKDSWGPKVDSVRTLVPAAGPFDHLHLAQAIAGRADFFVTRDSKIRAAAEDIWNHFGLKVVDSNALIRQIDNERRNPTYFPNALGDTQLSLTRSADRPHIALSPRIQNFARGERAKDLRKTIADLRRDLSSDDIVVIEDVRGDILGAFATRVHGSTLEVPLLRVSGQSSLHHALARHVAAILRSMAAEKSLDRVIVLDEYRSRLFDDALLAEAFVPVDGYPTCFVGRGIVHYDEFPEIASERDDIGRRYAAIDFERQQWPVKVLGTGIKTYVMPIKQTFASQLFGQVFEQQSLVKRPPDLGLSRELVYFRSTRNPREIEPGDRILWYVSGAGQLQNEGHIRLVSAAREIRVGKVDTMLDRFSRISVLPRKAARAAADPVGEIMAIRMSDIEILQEPLSLTAYRAIRAEAGGKEPFLQSIEEISDEVFHRIYQRSSAYV